MDGSRDRHGEFVAPFCNNPTLIHALVYLERVADAFVLHQSPAAVTES
jgi:hypothetical protein